MTASYPEAKAIFGEALAIESPGERAEFVAGACGDDAELRAEVDSLLSAVANAGSFMAAPVVEMPPTVSQPISEGPGTVIGRYKLLQQIGEGGMGVVFMAEQQKPVRRKVALKIIKPGMDTKEVIARFEAERQALALMDHPNIAKVLDAGATDSGRPYFVMDLVRGVPITDFCDENNLTPRERLDLFVSVCLAVQHAHQKGIIHRDIKPSNVLVTLDDAGPVAKVIDFGVAKATGCELTDKTLFTRFEQIVGTPMYMSPEQTEMRTRGVDTRSDIYSLGVLLYELLTGTTPFDRERLHVAMHEEICRIIREEDPPRPSTRISTLGESASIVAQHRKTEPGKLTALVRGDLDWIVMKALEKDRARRYETATGFAADIGRHLKDEAIEARPPSRSYRMHKFIRRNKVSVAAAILVMSALLLGITGTSVAMLQAWRQTRIAEELTHSLCELWKDDAITNVMGGDRPKTQLAIKNARLAGASKSWEHLVLGMDILFNSNSDDVDQAVKHFKTALELDKGNVAAQALLARAYLADGDIYAFLQERAVLDECRPMTAEDYLFLPFARLHDDPHENLRRIEKAIELRDSPLTRAMQAELLCHLAIDTGNTQHIETALVKIRDARAFMGDNSFALSIDLFVHFSAMRLMNEDDEFLGAMRREGDEIAVKLKRFPEYVLGHQSRARYLDCIGADKEIIANEWEQAAKSGGSVNRIHAAAYWWSVGNSGKALEQLKHNEDFEGFLRTILLGLETDQDREEACRTFIEMAENEESPVGLRLLLEALCLFGRTDYVRKRSQECLDSYDFRTPWNRDAIEFLAGETSVDQFLRKSEDSRTLRCRSYRLIGLTYFGNGDRDKASEYFEACVETWCLSSARKWARGDLLRMASDPHWPEWIKWDEIQQ